jgi:hypothetical protein
VCYILRSKEVTLLAFSLTVICPITGQDRPLGKAHIETQATQPTQGRAAQVSVIHTFECVSANWEVGQGSKVLRLLSPAPRSVPDTVLQRSPCTVEQRSVSCAASPCPALRHQCAPYLRAAGCKGQQNFFDLVMRFVPGACCLKKVSLGYVLFCLKFNCGI